MRYALYIHSATYSGLLTTSQSKNGRIAGEAPESVPAGARSLDSNSVRIKPMNESEHINVMQQKSPHLMSRRQVLGMGMKGLSAFALSAMPLPAEAQNIEQIQKYLEFDLESATDFDVTLVEQLIQTNPPARELKSHELQAIARYVQHTFTSISGKSFQAEIKKNYSRNSGEIRIYVTDDDRVLPPGIAGRFGHNPDPKKPNFAFIHGRVKASNLVEILFHELTHGISGPGEVRTSYFTAFGLLHMAAQKKIANIYTVLTEKNNPLKLLNPSIRLNFVKETIKQINESGSIPSDTLWYTILPMYAFATFRNARLLNREKHEPYSDLRGISNDDRLFLDGFKADLTNTRNREAFLNSMVDDFLKECVYFMKGFNSNVELPFDLKRFDQQ